MGKQCFSCKRCGRSMDSLAVSVGPDQDIYCNVCLKIVSAPERPQVITDTTIIMGSGDPENKDSCPRCGGKVFEAEKMTGKYGSYHRQCFKRKKCNSSTYGHKSKATLHEADCTQLQGEEGGADV